MSYTTKTLQTEYSMHLLVTCQLTREVADLLKGMLPAAGRSNH